MSGDSTHPTPGEPKVDYDNTSSSSLFLNFKATQNEPELLGMFMEDGGKLDAASMPWDTDFAVTGSAEATVVDLLDNNVVQDVSIEIPIDKWKKDDDNIVTLDPNMRVNISTSKMCTAHGGTIVLSVAGQGSEYMWRILNPDGHFQIGLSYSSWPNHFATVGISNAQIVMKQAGKDVNVAVSKLTWAKEDESIQKKLTEANQVVQDYAEKGWELRQQLVYKPCPMLTKTVFKEPVGINATGYSVVHDIVEREAPMELKTLDKLFYQTAMMALSGNSYKYERFKESTANPGLNAAKHARTVAYAVNLMVNFFMAYRVDGRPFVSSDEGLCFKAAESWLRQAIRSPVDGNDCDGSALLAIGIIKVALKLRPGSDEEDFPNLWCMRNAICTHYSVGLCIVGASSTEATSADGNHTTVAGHAIAILIPNMAILRALAHGASKTLGKEETMICKEDMRHEVAEARFRAVYTDEIREGIPDAEKQDLRDWNTAKDKFKELQPYAIEGTTPAAPVLYIEDSTIRRDEEIETERDIIAYTKASPNVFRPIQTLHVGGSKSGSTHRFYRDLIEITFPRSHPLYQNETLRELNVAASQYVISRHQNDYMATNNITTSGATPKDLLEEAYILIPMYKFGTAEATALDVASQVAAADVMPPRPSGAMQLNELQVTTLQKSMSAIQDLKAWASEKPTYDAKGHDANGFQAVTYIAAFSTLVHNPGGVMHFCNTIKKLAVSAEVTTTIIDGLACSKEYEGAPPGNLGCFVSIDAYIPV